MSDGVGVDVKAIAFGQHVADHRVDAPEQRLVLQLLVAEPDQRLECNLVAEPMVVAQLQNFGVDESLDQPKDIRVGAALDLAREPLFISRQGRERIGERQSVRQELVGGIEAASPDNVLVNIPSHPLGRLNAARIPFGAVDFVDRIHGPFPLAVWCADRMDEPVG